MYSSHTDWFMNVQGACEMYFNCCTAEWLWREGSLFGKSGQAIVLSSSVEDWLWVVKCSGGGGEKGQIWEGRKSNLSRKELLAMVLLRLETFWYFSHPWLFDIRQSWGRTVPVVNICVHSIGRRQQRHRKDRCYSILHFPTLTQKRSKKQMVLLQVKNVPVGSINLLLWKVLLFKFPFYHIFSFTPYLRGH